MANSAAGKSSPTSALWPLAAILVVAVFLVWLALTSEPSVVVAPEETGGDTTALAAANETATVVAPTEFEGNQQTYWGQEIQLQNVAVASTMGPQIVWIELPSGAPFLVKMNDALVQSGQAVAPQSRVTVVGRVLEKTDSVLSAWQQSGALQNDGHRQQAEFGTTYMEARRIQPASSQE
jgi:hypothetical protein